MEVSSGFKTNNLERQKEYKVIKRIIMAQREKNGTTRKKIK